MGLRTRAALAQAGFVLLAAVARADPETELWENILSLRVTVDGEVAYRAIEMYDQERLSRYVRSLADVDASGLGHDDAVAFWLNAYHAIVLLGVIQGYDPEVFEERAELYHWLEIGLAGEPRTLDEVRDLLSGFATADPRIHLVICNGTRGAPPLADEPFRGERLDAQLARAAGRFVNDPRWNRIDFARRRAILSPVFSWYRNDFERVSGSVPDYVSTLVEGSKAASILRRPEMNVTTGEFDWRLNAAPGHRPEAR